MAVKARLYPTSAEMPMLAKHCEHARAVFNIGLEQRSMWRQDHAGRRPSITVAVQMRQLAQARREIGWLGEGSSVVQQGALRDLDAAFTNFLAGRARYPRFRRRAINEGFVVRDLKVKRISRRTGMVLIPKTGWVRFRAHRDWAQYAAATSARVSLRNGHWHMAFTTTLPSKIVAGTGASVGIDCGVANTMATSDGQMFHAPGLSSGEQKRFLVLQRRLARQTGAAKKAGRKFEDCRRRNRTLAGLASLRRRLNNRRTNWVEQTTTVLARRYELVAVESLNTTGMTRRPTPKPDPTLPGAFLPNQARAKAALNRTILASRWGQIQRRLTDKMPTTSVVPVDPRNTSRTCAACGHMAAGNRESQAVFACQSCGHTAHADTNAAINILRRATTPNPRRSGDRTQQAPTGARVNHAGTVAA